MIAEATVLGVCVGLVNVALYFNILQILLNDLCCFNSAVFPDDSYFRTVFNIFCELSS